MLSSLEQAITDVLTTGQTLEFGNVFEAYKLHCDKGQLKDTHFYFQIALDKYPDATEKKQSPYAPLIANIRKEFFEKAIDAAVITFGAGTLRPCPCNCGAFLNLTEFLQQLEFKYGPNTAKIHLRRAILGRTDICNEYYSDQFQLPKSRSIKKNTKRRRAAKMINGLANKRSQSPELAFDPFGPSTSGTSM